jgi:hypothetical protein
MRGATDGSPSERRQRTAEIAPFSTLQNQADVIHWPALRGRIRNVRP